jgi:hypothetical protein
MTRAGRVMATHDRALAIGAQAVRLSCGRHFQGRDRACEML